MNTIRSMMKAVPLAACALFGQLHAAPTPQEIFAQLSAPAQSTPMLTDKRADALPALAYVPAEADMALACVTPGLAALEAMRLLGKPVPRELERGLSSIGSAALVAGSGSAAALERALPMLAQASQLETLSKCEAAWCERAKPEYVQIIRNAFTQQSQLGKQSLLDSLDKFHLAPIYYALTPAEGREADFATMHRQLVECMRTAAEQDPSLHFEQGGGFAKLSMSQLYAFRWLMKREPQDAAVREALAQRTLCLMTRAQEDSALIILCEQAGDVQLPKNAAYSLLCSPKLAGADAHIDCLLATAWVSVAFHKTLRSCSQCDRYPVAQAVIRALQAIGAQDPERQHAYEAAAKDLAWLVWQPDYFNELRTPFSMQVWQQGDAVSMETVSDAQGMTFSPGSLKLTQQAAAPDTLFYMESTAFAAPHMPNCTAFWNRLWSSLLGVSRGVALSLRQEHREQMAHYVHYADLFLPEVQALGDAMHTVGDALASPFALLACRIEPKRAASAWAFYAAVKDREGLGAGWRQLLAAVSRAAGKMGVPPMLVALLPVDARPLGGNAVSYELALPMLQSEKLPKVAVSDASFVMGSSAAVNARLMDALKAEAPMPFCGAVNAIHLPGLAAAAQQMQLPATCGNQHLIPDVLRRVSERVQSFWSVSTIADDVRTARGLMLLKR